MSQAYEVFEYTAYRNGQAKAVDAGVIAEQPVSLTVNGKVWLTFMCTPTDLDALAVGFLYNEGVLDSRDEIADIYICKNQRNVDIWLYRSVEEPQSWKRTSGCTGGYSAVDPEDTAVVAPNGLSLTSKAVLGLVRELFETQELYRKAGGVHSSALSDGKDLLIRVDDVGRHNTLDKIAGRVLLEGVKVGPSVLITTGRISSEMLQKSARLGASVVISRTSPTHMSVALAEKKGLTLIGYARGHRFNLYSHPERISFKQTERVPIEA